MALSPGTRLGPYEIEGSLGAGGMGEVYRARDTRLDRTVAIKVLPAHLAANADARARFEREARAVSALNHPNICTLHDVGREDGVDFLVMEHLEGETLQKRLERGRLSLDEIVRIAVPIAGALAAAHRQGVLHRDLKPGNVMLTAGGAKLLDFGLAKGMEASGPGELTAVPTRTTPLTAAGTIVGTFQYMAPEQIEGREADVRSDLWAFGAMLYEMAAGRRAFEGQTQASLIASILKEEPPPIPQVETMTPEAFDRVVRRCLAKNPDDRWQTARDLAAELEWIGASSSQVGIPAPGGARSPRARPGRWAAAVGAGLALLAAGWLLHRPAAAPRTVIRSSIVLPAGTALDSDNASLALSPDGTMLAYAAGTDSGPTQLWVRRLDALDAQPLAGTDGASYPFWSPDGRYLGFFAGRKLRKIPAGGGTAQSICDAEDGRGASWGAEGVILFAPRAFGPLMRVAAAGGAPAPATTEERPDWTHRNPRFLPDGRRALYFIGGPTGQQEGSIQLLDLATGESRAVLTVESEGLFVEPGFLVYVREGNLLAQPFDPDTAELSGDAVPIAENVQFNRFRWTGTYALSGGGLLLYRSGAIDSDSRLTWFDLDGNELGTVGEPAIFWFSPAISPDGRRALATIRSADGRSDLWMYDLERGLGGRFTFGDHPAVAPIWSPDGRQVVYWDGGATFYLQPTDGTARESALPTKGNTWAFVTDWSPDGSRVLAMTQSSETQIDLVLFPLDGDGSIEPLLATPSNERGGRFSPDGRWLAYLSDESGSLELYVVAYPGPGGKWQISSTGADQAEWLPDGSGLIYSTPRGEMFSVPVRADGTSLAIGASRPLLGGKARDLRATGWDLAPDGRRLLLVLPESGNEAPALTLVTNWSAELESR